MSDSYRQITGPDGKLARCEPFNGNSMSAFEHDGVYVVRSYGTTIAERHDDGTLVFNARRFSTTTSRHQNAARAWIPYTRQVDVDCPRGTTTLRAAVDR
jgi:hypothetical protein